MNLPLGISGKSNLSNSSSSTSTYIRSADCGFGVEVGDCTGRFVVGGP